MIEFNKWLKDGNYYYYILYETPTAVTGLFCIPSGPNRLLQLKRFSKMPQAWKNASSIKQGPQLPRPMTHKKTEVIQRMFKEI